LLIILFFVNKEFGGANKLTVLVCFVKSVKFLYRSVYIYCQIKDEELNETKNSRFHDFMRKAVLLLGITLIMLIIMNISPALPVIQKAFKGHENPQLYVMILFTIPSLALGVFSPLCGKVIDQFGRKKTFIFSLFVYAITATAPAFLDSLEAIIIVRFFLGIATATISTATLTLITDYYHGKERERMMSLKSVFVGLGGLIFLMIGGWLAQFSWRAPFYLGLFPLFIVIPAWIYLDEPEIIKQGGKKKSETPIPWSVMIPILSIVFVIKMMIYIIPMKLPFLLEEIFRSSSATNGMVLAFGTIVSTLSAFLFPNLRKYASHHQIFTICLFTLAIGFLFFSVATSYIGIFIGLTFMGFSFGWVVPNSSLLVAELTPIRNRGFMMGVLSSCLFLGQFFTPFFAYPIESVCGLRGNCGLFGSIGYFLLVLACYFLYVDISKKKTSMTG
jgi:MFS family permease